MAPPLTLVRSWRQTERVHDGQGLHGKGLVEFDQVQIGDGEPVRCSSLRTAGIGP